MDQPTLIDTHAHLDGPRFHDDLDEVLQRAHAGGINSIITVGCDIQSSIDSVSLAQRYQQIYASVGVHPHDAAQITPQSLAQLKDLAQHEKVVAIGEIGLDYYRNRCPHQQQQQAFRAQIQLARQCQLPIVVHDRDAHSDVLQILTEENAESCGGVLHCFSADLDMAQRCIELGFYLSFTGTITYPKNDEIREIIRHIPMERILVETDCPYLAPQQWRGKRNEPAYVVNTAKQIASIKQLSLDEVADITTDNAFRLFGVANINKIQ